MGFRHWVSHIRLDPNSQYLWYTHATFMFLWLHGILCSFPWKPMLKGLKGSSPNPNVFASKQCQACSSRQPWFVSELEASCPNLPWWTVALIFFGPTFPSLNLKDCPNMSKYVQIYYEIPIRFLYWLEAFEWPCRFPWACSIETNIYIYDKKQNSCAQFHNRNYEIFTQTQACRLVHQVCCGKAFPRESIKDFRT